MKEHYPPVDDVALKQDKKRVSYYYDEEIGNFHYEYHSYETTSYT